MKFADMYTVRKLADLGSAAVWHVTGDGVDRKVTIGSGMPSVTALKRALEEEAEDAAYHAERKAQRLRGGVSS